MVPIFTKARHSNSQRNSPGELQRQERFLSGKTAHRACEHFSDFAKNPENR
jgi:hypothetical protein